MPRCRRGPLRSAAAELELPTVSTAAPGTSGRAWEVQGTLQHDSLHTLGALSTLACRHTLTRASWKPAVQAKLYRTQAGKRPSVGVGIRCEWGSACKPAALRPCTGLLSTKCLAVQWAAQSVYITSIPERQC